MNTLGSWRLTNTVVKFGEFGGSVVHNKLELCMWQEVTEVCASGCALITAGGTRTS